MNTGEVAGDVISLIMSRTESQGRVFVDECLEVLSLCCSELIRSGFCPSHRDDAIEVLVAQIRDDLGVGK